MDIKNMALNEKLNLKPQKISNCRRCKSNFISELKMIAEYSKTCNECGHKISLQGRKYRYDHKRLLRFKIRMI